MDGLADQILSEGYQFIWGHVKIQQYIKYSGYMQMVGINIPYLRLVGFIYPNTIVSKIIPGTAPDFIYFSCYSTLTWTLIFISILIMSFIHLMRVNLIKLTRSTRSFNQHVKIFLETVINYISPFVSRALDQCHINQSLRLSLAIYLLYSMVISIEFNNFLLDYMQIELPTIKINTIEDLAKRSELKIILRQDSSLYAFADNGKTELARKIKTHLREFNDFDKDGIETKMLKGLMDGSIAYIQDHMILVITLLHIKKKKKDIFSLDNLHISTESAGYEPYFIMFDPDIPIWASLALNKT